MSNKFRFTESFGKGEDTLRLAVMRMGARDQLKMQARLITLFADVGGSLSGIFFDEDSDKTNEADSIMALVSSVKSIDLDDVIELIIELCEQCVTEGKDGERIDFSSVFDTRPIIMTYQVAIWVLKCNFKDFINGNKLKAFMANK